MPGGGTAAPAKSPAAGGITSTGGGMPSCNTAGGVNNGGDIKAKGTGATKGATSQVGF